MIAENIRLQKIRQAGGWRRLFIAGAILLAHAAIAWAWIGPGKEWEFSEQVAYALSLWSIGAAALGLLLGILAALDRVLSWVSAGFGFPPGRARVGLVAVLAGLTFLGALAQLMRYEIVMPETGAMRTGELCVVLDRWTGQAKPCTDQALHNQERKRAEPQRAEKTDREDVLWRRVASHLIELLEIERWLPSMIGRG
jgi:hypothetical protein